MFNESNKAPLCTTVITFLLSLLLGQLLSLFICVTAISSEYLAIQYEWKAPMFQSLVSYFLLSCVFGGGAVMRLVKSHSISKFLIQRGWKYGLAALLDLEGNYLMVKSYQFTSVSSVQLLHCLTIPTTLILSRWWLGARYSCWPHYVGVSACLVGVFSMVAGDAVSTQQASFTGLNPLLGNSLAVAGSVLYGVNNVWQERLVRDYSLCDYLGHVGVCATFFSGVQCLVLEWAQLSQPHLLENSSVSLFRWLWLFLFAISMFLFYVLTPVVMRRSNAVLVNLSLTSSGVYALGFSVGLFHYTFHWVYFLGATLTISGALVFVLREPGHRQLDASS